VAGDDILSDDLLRQLISVGEVDILVGLHTHNNAETVGHVVQVIRDGLLQYFPRARVAILNADGGSRDGSIDLVRAVSISDGQTLSTIPALRTMHIVSTQYGGGPSAGRAMHIVVAAADLLRAKACVIVAPESSEIQPEWIDRLLRPIFQEQFDFVTPVYRRHRFEGILVTNLLYPMTTSLYGRQLREPRPAEFAFSAEFAGRLIDHDLWTADAGRLGPEVCFTVEALSDGLRIFQTFLGPKGRLEQQSRDLVGALRQTVGPLFWSMERTNATWSVQNEIQGVPTAGPEFEVTSEAVRVDRKRLHQMFRSGVGDLQDVLSSILSPGTLTQLQHAASLEEDEFQFADELWVRTIYEFAASYHHEVINRDHILQALAPLYRGRAYTFLTENSDASADRLEARIQELTQTFERSKPYLLELWTAQERGS
jgi:hypothetical protein